MGWFAGLSVAGRQEVLLLLLLANTACGVVLAAAGWWTYRKVQKVLWLSRKLLELSQRWNDDTRRRGLHP